jgi:(1->4)-alpha-D-glucan 1-alpha-D-glucosylmutase
VTAPSGTYRVQVRPAFGFAATGELAGYLRSLGVSHLYSAPMLQAAPGSEHNYDVVDPGRPNSQLGGEEGRRELVAALRAHGLGLVADIVPNHLGVADAATNPAWWDLLTYGEQSRYASWFDIDWSPGRLLLPVLGDDAGAVRIEDGELRYHEHRFPIAPGTGEGTAAEVHERQHYELVSWRRAAADLNYRRFFAVSTLAGLRVEDPDVFAATHAELLRWHAAGELDGIRVDHPDGLRDPAGYLQRLRDSAAGAWLVVEKIVEPGEELPHWPVDGTTGYEALREIGGLFVDPDAEAAFTALDAELTGVKTDWAELAFACKRDVATGMMRSELRRLAQLAPEITDAEDALADVAACFPVYRSYLPLDGAEHLDHALAAARRRSPGRPFDALRRLYDAGDELAIRFQQFTGAVMAKGVEDTAFYRWTRFLAVNEVGGDPSRFGVRPAEYHAAAIHRQERWPNAMTTLSTHDTKRGEDVRARLAVLSELPSEWTGFVRRVAEAAPIPDGSIAHLVWQSAVGAWPIERERLHAYLEKAAREARTSTSWDDPDEGFEAAMHAAADLAYDDPLVAGEVAGFAARITPFGWSNSLGQKLVQLAGPGVPDVYQGCELWENSLVDPDNRRPVDFASRQAMLAALDAGELPEIDASGAVKLLVTSRVLRLRRDRPELFSGYTPLAADGPRAEHAVAFDRGGAIAVATRQPVTLEAAGGWHATALAVPDGAWTEVFTGRAFTGGPIRLGELLGRYPVALLARA